MDSEEEPAAAALGSSEGAQSGSPAAAEPAEPPAEGPEEGPPEEDWNTLAAFRPKATAG